MPASRYAITGIASAVKRWRASAAGTKYLASFGRSRASGTCSVQPASADRTSFVPWPAVTTSERATSSPPPAVTRNASPSGATDAVSTPSTTPTPRSERARVGAPRVAGVQVVVAERARPAEGGGHRVADPPALQHGHPPAPQRRVVGREQ